MFSFIIDIRNMDSDVEAVFMRISATDFRFLSQFEAWKREFVKQKKFIRTRTKPKIYYLPRVMDSLSEKRLHRTSKEIDGERSVCRKELEIK